MECIWLLSRILYTPVHLNVQKLICEKLSYLLSTQFIRIIYMKNCLTKSSMLLHIIVDM